MKTDEGRNIMPNIIDYVKWRGDLSTEASPFNDIDSLILSQITMINFKGIVPAPFETGRISLRDAADTYFADYERSATSLGKIIPPETKELFFEAGKSERFGKMMLSAYVSYTSIDEETQFAAMTADIGDGSRCVIFRGTDDSLVGWKEDLNLSFMETIPAQTEALRYLEDAASSFKGGIRVAGHSKGGNLSVYAATKADKSIQDRIITVYNHDAPGFSRAFLSSPEHERVEDKIRTIVPQSSVVGMLFENKGEYEIVKSTMSGILQHNPFSWEVLGNDFIKLDSLTEEGQRIAKVMNDWMANATLEEKERFADAFYNILAATEATTLTELYADKYAVVRAIKDTDKETRNMVFSVIGIIFEEGGRIFRENLFGNSKKKKLEEGDEEKLDEAFADAKRVLDEMRKGADIPEATYTQHTTEKRAVARREMRQPKTLANNAQRTRQKRMPPQNQDKTPFITDLAHATRAAVRKKTGR